MNKMKRHQRRGAIVARCERESSRNLRHLFMIQSYFIMLLLPTTSSVYERRAGYGTVPYDAGNDEDGEEGRMSGDRGYNTNPNEFNVDGIDNVFSRENNCSPDANDLYGSDEGIDQDLGFYYQVETLPILENAEQVQKDILEAVETSVSKTLMPSLLLDDCAVTGRSRQNFHIQHRRLAEMLGITTLPTDTVLEGGTCKSLFLFDKKCTTCMRAMSSHFFSSFSVECEGELSNELNECFVVDGSMTLFSTSAVSDSFVDGLRNIIQQAMDDGNYNKLHPQLVKVSYREDLETRDAGVPTAVTPEPTYSPTTTPRCELNKLGAFGTFSLDRRAFEFYYQVETTSDGTEDILRNDLLPILEKEYGNRLLALFFSECGEDERRIQDGGNACEARGFSGLPIDSALAGVSCMPDSRLDPSNTCFAVDGGLTMYFDGVCTDVDKETMDAIRQLINSGDFDRLDPRIVNVIHLDISDINLDDATTLQSRGSETTNLPGYAIVLLTIAALGLLVGFLLFVVGRRKPQDNDGFDNFPDDEGEGDF